MGDHWPIETIGPTLSGGSEDSVLEFVGIDPVIAAASLLSRGHVIDAFILTISDAYPAPMAARDISTLSYLGTLRNVVVDAQASGPAVAELIEKSFTNDAITFKNEAGELREAFNRPAPEHAPLVWWRDGTQALREHHARQLVQRA